MAQLVIRCDEPPPLLLTPLQKWRPGACSCRGRGSLVPQPTLHKAKVSSLRVHTFPGMFVVCRYVSSKWLRLSTASQTKRKYPRTVQPSTVIFYIMSELDHVHFLPFSLVAGRPRIQALVPSSHHLFSGINCKSKAPLLTSLVYTC